MNRILKVLAGILAGLVVLIVIAAVIVVILSGNLRGKTYDIEVGAISVSDDPAVIERGQYLVQALSGCQECHGENLSGDNLIDSGFLGTIYAPNLTPGEGGTSEFADADWVRAIRHGVALDGTGLLIMPSTDYFNYTDEDLGAVIAYLKTLEPVDNTVPEPSLRFAHFLLLLDTQGFIPAEAIDHKATFVVSIEPEPSADYGAYLASIACAGCHGKDYAGQSFPDGRTPATNLTPAGALAGYSADDFKAVLRTGLNPAGRVLEPDDMPWTVFAKLTDEDIEAIWLFMQTLPAVES